MKVAEKPVKPSYKELEDENRRLEKKLRQSQKMEAIGMLAGGIAHDFNNILSAIMGYTELCLQDSNADLSITDRLKKVLQASNRAKDLIGQLLTFSRQQEQEQRPIELNLIVKEVASLLRASLPASIDIRIEDDTSGSLVLADPVQMHQVLMNLCTNAYHAMQDSGGRLTISVLDHVDQASFKGNGNGGSNEAVRLSISDTGCGIAPALIGKIFEPYFSTKTLGEGTGLGLSVVKGIIRNHGGDILVESTPGVGTTFDIIISKIKQPPVKEHPKEVTLPTGSERILLVDDESFIMEITVAMLQSLGYQITSCDDSAAALDLFRKNSDQIDLVITDLSMPNMSGIELADAIREINPAVPIVLCSGFSDAITEDKALRVGIKAILRKPILRADLANTVHNLLETE